MQARATFNLPMTTALATRLLADHDTNKCVWEPPFNTGLFES